MRLIMKVNTKTDAYCGNQSEFSEGGSTGQTHKTPFVDVNLSDVVFSKNKAPSA